MTRPTKLNDQIKEKIVQRIRAGNTLDTAARSAGISESTFHRWIRKGKDQERGPYREFYEDVQQARADAEARHVAQIAEAAKGNWRAAAWWLERNFPDKWAQGELSLKKIRQRMIESGSPNDEPEGLDDGR